MSLDRQSARFLWFWIFLAPLGAAAFVEMAWEQWHSDVWESHACVRRWCPGSPAEDVLYTAVEAATALAVAVMMALKALARPIVPRSNLTKVARAVGMASCLAAGVACLARVWALAHLA